VPKISATQIARRRFLGAALPAGACGGAHVAAAEEDSSKLGRTPHTRFAVNVEMWFRKLPFLDRVRQSAALGFPAIEFWPYQGKDLKALAALCRQFGVQVAQFTAWGFRPGMNDPANHAKLAATIREACGVARDLDCKLMTVVGGDNQPGMSQAQMHENIIKGLKLVAPIAEEHGVTLILEPMNVRVDHKGHCLYGSEPAMAICEAVGSPHVKINWDLYHMQITEGDLTRRLREGFRRGHVGYLQVADNPGRNEPGTGEVCFARVLKEAYDLGYRGCVGLECNPKEGELVAARRVAAADRW
jgi:hydroxypyruvate isomerase